MHPNRFEVRQRFELLGEFSGYARALRFARAYHRATKRYTLIWDHASANTGNVVWTSKHGQVREIKP